MSTQVSRSAGDGTKETDVTMDTINLSLESNAVLMPGALLDDEDIDVAAEQIVQEFTEHLQQRAPPPLVVDEMNEDDEAVGILSSSLAAGGFEELIVALDAPPEGTLAPSSTIYHDSATTEVLVVEEEDEEEDLVEEEVDEVSYDEEEVMDESLTEVEFDDVDIEEIMEESGLIMAEALKPSVLKTIVPADTEAPTEIHEVYHNSADTMDAFATTTTVTTINSMNDSIAMDLSETTRNTAGEPLYGDVLLGDISEMTTGSKSGFYDPSTRSSNVHTDSMYSRGSSIPSDTPSATSITTPPVGSKSRSMQAAYGEVAAVAAAAAMASNQAPVPPAMQGAPALSEPLDHRSSIGITETSNIIVPTEPPPYYPPDHTVMSMSVPVPPALSGAPATSFPNEDDLEAGKAKSEPDISMKEPEMAQSFSAVKDAAAKTEPPEDAEITEGMNLSFYGAGLLCLLVVFIAVILSVVLTRGNDDGADRNIPSPAPVGAAPSAPSPVASPTVVVGPPIVLGTWTQSIAPVFGSTGSSFGAAIVVDDSYMWAIGAPNMADTNGVDSGAVITSTFENENWELIPALPGKSTGDAFGSAIDLSMNHMIVGAPNSLIPNTTTPAGAAFYYTFDTTNKAWTESATSFRSSDDLLSSNGAFGAAVAIGFNSVSILPRVAIGAPKHNLGTNALEVGRVYTFEAISTDGTDWSALGSNPILGRNAFDWFGASVDVSMDGTHFVVGAPGANSSGYFQVYEWDGSEWNVDFEQEGFPGEGLGSDVVFLTADVVAVGGSGYENGSGRVFVYRRSSTSEYIPLGESIVGHPGDRLGAAGTITGGSFGDEMELILVVSTATGYVMTYVFDESMNAWRPRFETLSLDTDSNVVLEYSSSTGLIVSYPAGDEVSFYTDQGAFAAPPTNSPSVHLGRAANYIIAHQITAPVGAANNNSTTPSDGTWSLVGASFMPMTDAGSGLGASVSFTSTSMVVGAPITLENGAVFVYHKDGVWNTQASQEICGTAAGMEFGAAVDLSSTLLAVGAPRALAPSTLTEFGAVYPYALVNGQWEVLGATILGDEDIYSASEMFGAAVSVASTVNRIAVGAPFSNLDNQLLRGRVYVYEFSSTSSTWTLMQTMAGQDSNHFYGRSIDLSPDGAQLVIGAPGGGAVELWEYDGKQWNSQFLVTVGTPGFGAVVVWITLNLFAVSDPNYNSDTGRVVLYQKDSTLGTFLPSGPELTGAAEGEQLGLFLAGNIADSIVTLIVGAATGTVRRVDLDVSSNAWVPRGASVTTNVTSLAAASAEEFVVGASNAVEIYQWSTV